jgi:hypothetical protein
MKFIVFLLSLFTVTLTVAFAYDQGNFTSPFNSGCQVDINRDLGERQPLYIVPGTSRFHHPTGRDGIMRFTQGQTLELHCDSGFEGPSGISGNTITITCSSGVIFTRNGVFNTINQFFCRRWPTPTLRRRTSPRCFNNGIYVDTGFVVGTRWLQVFSTCHDLVTEENYYTIYSINAAADGGERNVIRPNWSQGDFFPGKNVDSLHTRNNQRNTIAGILGSSALADRIIEPTPSDVFLARGHMAAMTDFVSANEQRSTFFFTNTAPQFQTFNGGNWVSVEISSRRLAADRNINLQVYTGTFGIVQFANTNNQMRDIHLAPNNRQIPVPRIYYKILVNTANRQGVVLIGVNNPHLSVAEINSQGYVVCNDVSSRLRYLSWSRTNLVRGFSYACEVPDFLRAVPHVASHIGTISGLLV